MANMHIVKLVIHMTLCVVADWHIQLWQYCESTYLYKRTERTLYKWLMADRCSYVCANIQFTDMYRGLEVRLV